MNANGLSGAQQTIGNLTVGYSSGTASVAETDNEGNVEQGTPGTFSLPLGSGVSGGSGWCSRKRSLNRIPILERQLFRNRARSLLLPITSGNLANPGPDPQIQFAWSNLGDLKSAVPTTSNVGDLSGTKSFAIKPIMAGFSSILTLITQWEDSSNLNTDIPFVDKTISQLVNFSGDTTSAFTAIENAIRNATTPQQLDADIQAALPTGEITATANDNPNSNDFELALAMINDSPVPGYHCRSNSGQVKGDCFRFRRASLSAPRSWQTSFSDSIRQMGFISWGALIRRAAAGESECFDHREFPAVFRGKFWHSQLWLVQRQRHRESGVGAESHASGR